jgi:formate dehydrogenase subunit delta
MHIDYLIKMANDIGAFFTGVDAEDVAAANICAHIKRFWDPRMRAQIVAHYSETRGADLQGAVRLAIAQLAEEAAKKKQT